MSEHSLLKGLLLGRTDGDSSRDRGNRLRGTSVLRHALVSPKLTERRVTQTATGLMLPRVSRHGGFSGVPMYTSSGRCVLVLIYRKFSRDWLFRLARIMTWSRRNCEAFNISSGLVVEPGLRLSLGAPARRPQLT